VVPNCGWARGKADVLYVANAFEVTGKLNNLLAESKKEEHIAAATDCSNQPRFRNETKDSL
jgi:hypothetical protein